ncbi:hypothetical protein ElP_73770 (plasmid) [Tautonia plasticadhaerens]|uniref:Uncharacterized protein n=1 Tax=Tautonia plasticadhaerens TaxID=2527974 RepID=A0A518HEY0_9BACT|nr:hypothetical protein ElP_73770 [Tautonia plasticadhaerens]
MAQALHHPDRRVSPDLAAVRSLGLAGRWDVPPISPIRMGALTTSRPINAAERPGKELS